MTQLGDFTMARVGLGRAGDALPTRELLALRLARAAAGDAVHDAIDMVSLRTECERRRWECAVVHSKARDRAEYLRRPDLGRVLDDDSGLGGGPFDLSIVIADGLSALAVNRHAIAVVDALMRKLHDAQWKLAPIVLAEQARVAIGDDIGAILRTSISLVLIGERPGLTAYDSLGAYLTWSPMRGRTDAERNCVSNIRPEGLGYQAAAGVIFALLTESRRLRLSGVALKSDAAAGQLSA